MNMANQTVTTSTRLWSEEVRRAESKEMLETAQAPFPVDRKKDIAYEFTNRKFVEGNGVYQ
jgi:hypothetical protein